MNKGFPGKEMCSHLFTRFKDVALERVTIAVSSNIAEYLEVMTIMRYVEYSAKN